MAPGNYRHPQARLTALAIITMMVLGACTQAPLSTGTTPATNAAGRRTERVSIEQICAAPEAKLIYPGATVLGPLGLEERGTSGAFCGAIIATPDDQVAVYDWYTHWLQDHGYQFYTDFKGGAMLSTRTFQKLPDCTEFFMMGPDNLKTLGGVGVKTKPLPADTRTVFEFTYSRSTMIDVSPCKAGEPLPPVPPTRVTTPTATGAQPLGSEPAPPSGR